MEYFDCSYIKHDKEYFNIICVHPNRKSKYCSTNWYNKECPNTDQGVQ